MRDVVVIGAGLAGLAATIRLAKAGQSVTLVTKGIGGLQLGQGTIDILGYTPERVDAPLEALEAHCAAHPAHPYAHFTGAQVGEAVSWLAQELGEELLVGDPSRNFRLPTAIGALRPTALAQPSMLAGEPADGRPYCIVGLERLKDFYPMLVAENLSRHTTPSGAPIEARATSVDLEVRRGEFDTSGLNHARALDDPKVRAALVKLVKPLLKKGEVVGFPAVLGLKDYSAWRDIAAGLGHDVFEIPLPPPSVPGMRLNEALTAIVKDHARLVLGSRVTGADSAADGTIRSVTISQAGRERALETKNVILAAGGFESGALAVDSYGTVEETILGLPVVGADGDLLHADFWGDDQPLFLSGLTVDDQMRPLRASGTPVHPNVYAAGGNLAGSTRWREKTGEGIAIASAVRAADSILGSK